jgi:hypothetical protein
MTTVGITAPNLLSGIYNNRIIKKTRFVYRNLRDSGSIAA